MNPLAETREKDSYLKTILAAVPAAVMIIDPDNYKIIDANPCAAQMLGCPEEELIGRDFYELRDTGEQSADPEQRIVSDEYTLRRDNEDVIHVRRTLARARVRDREYLVQSMLDITDIRHLMKKLEISIDLAKHLLQMINPVPPRYTHLADGLVLFAETLSFPCYKEGGDHSFVRNFFQAERAKTVISLKDQSGHEVGCVLRSIITDLIHHSLLNRYPAEKQEIIISRLNAEILRSGLFQSQDFFTSVNAEICHLSSELRYVSAGHPRFLLIRGAEVTGLPEPGGPGKNLFIPIHSENEFSAGLLPLQEGDRLIFYTDGLTEMPRTGKNAFLRFEELRKLTAGIAALDSSISVGDLMRSMIKKIADMSHAELIPFAKNTSLDDITMLGLEIESRKSEKRVLYPNSSDDLYRIIPDLYREIAKETELRGFRIPRLAIRSILAEGLLNAWRHGNRQAADKSLTLCWRFGNDFHLEIKDQGKGFDYSHIPDPKEGEFFYRSSGRGIYIIRRYADSVRWEDQGRNLIISIQKHKETSLQEYARQSAKTMPLW